MFARCQELERCPKTLRPIRKPSSLYPLEGNALLRYLALPSSTTSRRLSSLDLVRGRRQETCSSSLFAAPLKPDANVCAPAKGLRCRSITSTPLLWIDHQNKQLDDLQRIKVRQLFVHARMRRNGLRELQLCRWRVLPNGGTNGLWLQFGAGFLWV